MRKKITMLFAALLACVGVMKAEGVNPTALPEMSTEGNIKWYTIKNVRQQKYATYAGDAETMTQQANASAASFFYFTASSTEGAVKIHNYAAGEKLCAAYNSWTATGIDWYLAAQTTGVSICTSTGEWNAWNDASGEGQKIEYWSASDPGSAWEISLVTDFSAIIDIAALKTAAIAEINNYATVSVLYPSADDAVAAVEAVNSVSNGLKDLNDAAEAINAIVVGYRNAAYKALEGKYYTIKTPARGNGYMQMATSKVIGTAEVASPANIWQFVCNDDGTLKVYNPYTGKYLCEPQGGSTDIAVTTEQANAGVYILNINASAENKDAKVKFTSNGKSVHMDVSSNLVRWDNGGASEWQVVEITNFSSMITSYKTSSIATLDSWATLSVVFDATLINAAKTAINAINTTDWATFAAIDAELTEATDAVAAKMFTFQTIATDNHREGVWVSANMTTEKAIGLHGEHNYNSIWSLRHAGGVAFYLYNELNSVYMGAPSANCPLTEAPAVAYTFEIIDAENSVVEMHTNGETLHASNHNDDKLLNHDGNESASRWTIRTIDVAADIQTLLDGLTEDDYAEVPALGQYPTAAYNALVEARTSAKTVEEVEVAIATFKAAKNLPVFTIDGVISYAAGKSIYDDNNDAPNFNTTDNYDKTMWWALDMTETTVKVTEEVGIYNVGTGNGFWGASTIKITETSDAVEGEDDEIFLFYILNVGKDNTMHAQENGSVIVNYNHTSKDGGSAWRFTYIGNSYDLNKLAEEHVAAVVDKENSFRTFYAEFPAAIDAATAAGKTIDLISSITLGQAIDINKVVTLNLNGKTITRTGEGYAFEVTGELILEGEGSISGIHYIINDADYKTKPYSMSVDKKNVDITYNRTFGHTNWQVLYVPFAIPVASMSEFDVYAITDANSDAVVVDQVTEGTLAAHTPYLIKASETGNKAITVKNGTLEAPENYSKTIGGYTFTGTYEAKKITTETEYVLTGGEWCQLDNSDQVLGAFRVYLTVNGSAAPVLRIMTRGEEDTTAIDSAVLNVQPSSVIYDLLGRRVEKMDKGIYIVNGRKVVVK